ncbi:MAG: hypothetical protein LBH45_03615 [Campylobacteraceae bacterium]|jgi:hypothetical protein|nr:hypothetical protein [Campylobacteraceae bacterium]
MKILVVIVLVLIGIYFFRQEIVGKIEGDLKHIPDIVKQYNDEIMGIDYLIGEQRIALELKGICAQNSAWLNYKETKIFAQNCADANSALK